MSLTLAIPEISSSPTPGDWAERITRAWQQTREGVISVGQLLIDAKAELEHGAWQAMIDSELPFGVRTAQMLMKIAGDTRLTNASHISLLPPSYGTLYELTKLDDGTLNHAFTKGLIKPDMERKDAERLRKAAVRTEKLRRVEAIAAAPAQASIGGVHVMPENHVQVAASRQDAEAGRTITIFADPRTNGFVEQMLERRYAVIYADPATRFETFSEAGMEKAAENHYPTMTWEEIRALPVPAIAAYNAVLFLWATVPNLLISLQLMEHWGFDYRSHQAWLKTTADGTPHRGTGYWFINCHELLLVGVRGDMPAPLPGTQDPSLIEHAVGEHSAKPDRFRQMIDRYYPGVTKIELFARSVAPGWDAWGNQVSPPRSGVGAGPSDRSEASCREPDAAEEIAARRPLMGPGSDAEWEPNPDWKGPEDEEGNDGR